MATKVADLRADLTLATASFESGLQRARRETRQFQEGVRRDLASVESQFTKLTAVAANFGRGLLVGVAAAGVTAGFRAIISETTAAQDGLLKLQSVLKATGNTSGLSLKQITAFADGIEASTTTASEAVTAAAARLATFGSVSGDTFKRTLGLANDLAAVFGGDLADATEKLGRALQDPVNGLTGLTREVRAFSPAAAEAAAQLAQMGDQAGAQKVILDELARTVGGAGEASRQGLTGAFFGATSALGNMLERFGEASGITATLDASLRGLAATLDSIGGGNSASPEARIRQLSSEAASSLAEAEKLRAQGLGFNADMMAGRAESLTEESEALRQLLRLQNDRENAAQLSAQAEAKAAIERVAAAKKEAEAVKEAEGTKLKAVSSAISTRAKLENDAAADRERQREGELASLLASYREDARVAQAVEQQKIKAQEDAARDAQRIAEQNAEIFAEPFKEAARQIQDAVAGALRMGMEGEIATAKDVAETIKGIFFQMASQVATLAIFNPSALAGLGGGGTFGSMFSSLSGTALGGVGIGSTLTAGALGVAGGGILAGLLGGNSTGGSIGGGLGAAGGAILGSLVPGIGTVLGGAAGGAIGSIIGGLFGGSGGGGDHNDNYRASFVNGAFANVQNTKPSEGNVNNVTQVGQQIAALYAALQARGGSFTGTLGLNSGNQDGLQLTTASGTKNYGNVQQLSLAAAKALIGGTEGLSGLDRQILGRSKATDAAGLIADLQFADTFQQLTGAVTPFVAELKNLLKAFDEQDKKAKELGLSVTELDKAQAKQLATLRAQKSAQIVALREGYLNSVDSAFSFAAPIEQLRNELSGGGTARKRLGTAQADFERVRRQVAAGRVEGFRALPDAAQAYLAAGRENFASGSGYAEILAVVQRVLNSADVQIDAVRDPLVEGVGKVDQTLADVGDAIEVQKDEIVSAIKSLGRDLRSLRAA